MTNPGIITLAWPDKRLSPNARLHWRAKVGPKQSAKIAAGWAAVAMPGFHAVREALQGSEGPIPMRIVFYPPDRRHRDDDNMIASFKAARDGIAEAFGVDDRRFRPHYFFEEPCAPGRVEVVIENQPDTSRAPVNNCASVALSAESCGMEMGGPVDAQTSSPALHQQPSRGAAND